MVGFIRRLISIKMALITINLFLESETQRTILPIYLQDLV